MFKRKKINIYDPFSFLIKAVNKLDTYFCGVFFFLQALNNCSAILQIHFILFDAPFI